MTKERRVRGLHITFIYCQLSFGKYKVSKERLSRKEKGENSRKWKKIKQDRKRRFDQRSGIAGCTHQW